MSKGKDNKSSYVYSLPRDTQSSKRSVNGSGSKDNIADDDETELVASSHSSADRYSHKGGKDLPEVFGNATVPINKEWYRLIKDDKNFKEILKLTGDIQLKSDKDLSGQLVGSVDDLSRVEKLIRKNFESALLTSLHSKDRHNGFDRDIDPKHNGRSQIHGEVKNAAVVVRTSNGRTSSPASDEESSSASRVKRSNVSLEGSSIKQDPVASGSRIDRDGAKGLVKTDFEDDRKIQRTSSRDFITLARHQLSFIREFYAEIFEYIKSLKLVEESKSQVILSGSPDEIKKLSDWCKKHDIGNLHTRLLSLSDRVLVEDIKAVKNSISSSLRVCLEFPNGAQQDPEIIGRSVDIDFFQGILSERAQRNAQLKLTSGLDSQKSSRNVLSSKKNFEFTMPLSSLRIVVAKGNLVEQTTDAIVNPSNPLLKHIGGAAKAIADAAGKTLVDECKRYISINKMLPTGGVMHTSAGKLNPSVKYVIHTVGPDSKAHYRKNECQVLLEKTFVNCFKHANDVLHLKSLSVPAISSGVFGMSKDFVALCSWNALMTFDKEMSSAAKVLSLREIHFINIDAEATESIIKTFKEGLDKYSNDQKKNPGAAAKSSAARGSRGGLRRSNSFSGSLRSDNNDTVTQNPTVVASPVASAGAAASSRVRHRSSFSESRGTFKDDVENQDSRGETAEASSGTSKGKSANVVDSPASDSTSASGMPKIKESLLDKTDFKKSRKMVSHNSCLSSHGQLCHDRNCMQCARDVKSESGSNRNHAMSPPVSARNEKATYGSDTGAAMDDPQSPSDDDRAHQMNKEAGHRSSPNELKSRNSSDDKCCICWDDLDNPKTLDCGHIFCKDCIEKAFLHKPKCPTCGRIYGQLIGNQPPGKMKVDLENYPGLPGYEQFGTLAIYYDIPDGIQTSDHPNPGERFKGTYRTAFLPANQEGKEISELLRKAFDAKLIFTVGRSNTTGRENVVVWNDIHHKTSRVGQYGYPDPTYLSRVRDELAAKGIQSSSPVTDDKKSLSGQRDLLNSPKNTAVASSAYSARFDNYSNEHDFRSLPVDVNLTSPVGLEISSRSGGQTISDRRDDRVSSLRSTGAAVGGLTSYKRDLPGEENYNRSRYDSIVSSITGSGLGSTSVHHSSVRPAEPLSLQVSSGIGSTSRPPSYELHSPFRNTEAVLRGSTSDRHGSGTKDYLSMPGGPTVHGSRPVSFSPTRYGPGSSDYKSPLSYSTHETRSLGPDKSSRFKTASSSSTTSRSTFPTRNSVYDKPQWK